MKLYECNIGDKVKIIGGLDSGCRGRKDKIGIIISREDYDRSTKSINGWNLEFHKDEKIGFVESEYEIHVVNNDCFVELLEKSNNNKNIKEKNKSMKNFRIVDYKVYNNKAVNVTFKDEFNREHRYEEEKAVCNEDDKFELRRGLEICVLKHILGEDTYKQIIKEIERQIKALDKAAKDKKALDEMIARKKAKNARRKAARQEKARQERIDEMKEAYLAAMKEYGASNKPIVGLRLRDKLIKAD